MTRLKSLSLSCWLFCVLVSAYSLPVEESSDSHSPYHQVPCDIRPLSGWMDDQGNLWGVGASDLWWYNLSASAWNFVALPNANRSSTDSSSWRVACGKTGDFLVLMSRKDTYMFRIPQQEWKRVGLRLPGPSGNRTAQWCHNDSLLLLDLSQSALYQLNPVKGKWTKRAKTLEILQMFNYITHETFKHTVTWYGSNDSLYLFLETPTNTSKGSLGSLWSTRLTNVSWSQVAGQGEDSELWPDLHTEAVTWVSDDSLWLWKLGVDMEEVWQFELSTKIWTQVLLKQTGMEDHSDGPSMTKRLASWTHGEELCVLTTRGTCASEYVPGTTWCLHTTVTQNFNKVFNDTDESNSIPSLGVISWNATAAQHILTLDLENQSSVLPQSPEAQHLSSASLTSDHKSEQIVRASWLPKVDSISDTGYSMSSESSHVSVSSSFAKWPQQHSSVFGSIIFFGTSITIFAVIGVFWCVRKCVHFPKEALLLRDPPSVRYTAIPDTLA